MLNRDVCVSLDITSTALSAFYVLMDKLGTKGIELVNVKRVLCGMEIIVLEWWGVLEIEFITSNISNVSVLTILFGMDILVWFSLIVAVDKHGTKRLLNVIALKVSIGMIITVSCVLMGKLGVLLKKSVFVDKELNGMAIFVLWFNNVLEDPFGIKIHGHASVLLILFGMEDSVSKILALEDKFGTILKESVCVLEDKS